MSDGTWNLSTSWPIALFPVRLETRFLGGELCIRVIPDTIHADTHEPELTAAELAAGQRYWQQVAGADVGTATARVARAGRPVRDRAGRLARPRGAPVGAQLRGAVPAGARGPQRWTRAPRAPGAAHPLASGGLAGRGVDSGSRLTDRRTLSRSGRIPSSGGLAMPAWMRDFSTAESIGMGLRLPLTADMQQQGLDLLLVYGVEESGDSAAGAQEVSELLDAHYYTDGFGYVPPGTPTNNTEAAASGLDTPLRRVHPLAYLVSGSDQPPTDAAQRRRGARRRARHQPH